MDNERQTKKVLRRCNRSLIKIDRRLVSIEKRQQNEYCSVNSCESHLSPLQNHSIYSTLKDIRYLRNDMFDQQLFGRYRNRVTSISSSFHFRSCERNNRRLYSYTDCVLNSNVSTVRISDEESTSATIEAAINNIAAPSSTLQDDEVVRQSKLRHCLPQQQNVSIVHDTVESSKKTKTLSEPLVDYYSESYANSAVNHEGLKANEVVSSHHSKANVQLTNKGLQSFVPDNSLKLYSYNNLNSESTRRQDAAGYFIFNKNMARADRNDKRLRWQRLPDCLESSLTSSSEKLLQIKREFHSERNT